MRNEIELYEQIENYLRDNLPEEERYAFEIRISSDPDLERMIEEHRQLADFIEEGTLLEIRDSIRKIHDNNFGGKRGFSGRKPLSYTILGIVVVLSVSIWLLKKPVSEKTIAHSETVPLPDSVEAPVIEVKIETETINIKKVKPPVHPVKIAEDLKEPHNHNVIAQTKSKAFDDTIKTEDNIIRVENKVPIILPQTSASNTDLKEGLENKKSARENNVNCDTVHVSAKVETAESCEERATGKILVVIESSKGSSPPYFLSIDNGSEYQQASQIVDLPPGIYPVWLKDKNDCLSIIGNFLVGSISCDYDYIFAPDRGERWEIPTKNKSGKIKIYTKEGSLIYSEYFEKGQIIDWDGISLDGDPQPMGVYRFILEFSDGNPLIGNVTIVR